LVKKESEKITAKPKVIKKVKEWVILWI
jgi:hypothetical protein